MNRAKTLEERVLALEEQLESVIDASRQWQKLSLAAPLLKISTDSIRRRIQHAKEFPKNSPYKKGIHWRNAGNHYQIHASRWEKAMQKESEK